MDKNRKRFELSKKYLFGKGLEIGALNLPLPVKENIHVIYVDKITQDEALNQHYMEFNTNEISPVDILDDGEELSHISSESQDFIIANHFLEHTQNPLKCIENHLSKIKVGGILYYAVPDKGKTFDLHRPLTSFEHIIDDYKLGPEISYDKHWEEWKKLVVEKKPEHPHKGKIDFLKKINFSIHYHVWNEKTFVEFINKTNEFFGYPFHIVEYLTNNLDENIIILIKTKSESQRRINKTPIDEKTVVKNILFQIYTERKDLQSAFPEVKDENFTNLFHWAKKYGIKEESRLINFSSFFDSIHN